MEKRSGFLQEGTSGSSLFRFSPAHLTGSDMSLIRAENRRCDRGTTFPGGWQTWLRTPESEAETRGGYPTVTLRHEHVETGPCIKAISLPPSPPRLSHPTDHARPTLAPRMSSAVSPLAQSNLETTFPLPHTGDSLDAVLLQGTYIFPRLSWEKVRPLPHATVART